MHKHAQKLASFYMFIIVCMSFCGYTLIWS